jgi:Right handed beta helix region
MSRRWVVFALAAVLLCVMPAVPATAAGPTHVTSHISGNVTWTRTGSPYIVDIATLWVQPGATLTIQPGVKVVMNQPLGVIEVKGNLQAIGTKTRHIVFTGGPNHFSGSTAKGQWRFISFENAGTGRLDYVEIRYGGYLRNDFAPWAASVLRMNSSLDVWVTNSSIHDNNNSGVLATANVPIHISSTEIYNNDIGVAVVGTSNGVVEIDHSSLHDNSSYGLFTNHSSPPVMQSFITQSNITDNWVGVRLHEPYTPAEKYPTGDFNNIWGNGLLVDQLEVLNPRITNESLWEPNYWGGTFWLAPCPWALTTWQWHLAPISDLFPSSNKGPIQSTKWTLPDGKVPPTQCRTDDMPVGDWSNDVYGWTIPGPFPP